MGFTVRGNKDMKSVYTRLNNRGVCLVYSSHCTNNVMCVFFHLIILVRDDWSNFTDEETKPHRSKLASPGHNSWQWESRDLNTGL